MDIELRHIRRIPTDGPLRQGRESLETPVYRLIDFDQASSDPYDVGQERESVRGLLYL
jgi:hypothetical protein